MYINKKAVKNRLKEKGKQIGKEALLELEACVVVLIDRACDLSKNFTRIRASEITHALTQR